MARGTYIGIQRRGGGEFICAGLERQTINALVLIERMRYRWQPDPSDVADFNRRGSFDVKCLPVCYLRLGR